MKILYLTLKHNNLPPGMEADYMSDLLYHGLYSLHGSECVDYPAKDHLRPDYPYVSNLWGRGFSYAKTLVADEKIDRTDIDQKIMSAYYDLIVVSVHHTMHNQPERVLEFLQKAKANQPKNKLVLVDGNDLTSYEPRYLTYVDKYFKREIPDNAPDYLTPIHFAIPEEKLGYRMFRSDVPHKTFAYIHPGSCESHWPPDSRKTHIYENEKDYYFDYFDSLFAFTCKKGGWDCMRHYEILSQGCVPIFTDIELCPKRTLTNLPKDLLSRIKDLPGLNLATSSENKKTYGGHDIIQLQSTIDWNSFDVTRYREWQWELENFTLINLTTKALAKYFLGRIYNDGGSIKYTQDMYIGEMYD